MSGPKVEQKHSFLGLSRTRQNLKQLGGVPVRRTIIFEGLYWVAVKELKLSYHNGYIQ